jgi:hypothetical protein
MSSTLPPQIDETWTQLLLEDGSYLFPKSCCYCLKQTDLVTKKIYEEVELYEPVWGKSGHQLHYKPGKVRGTQACICEVPICRTCRKALRVTLKGEDELGDIQVKMWCPPILCLIGGGAFSWGKGSPLIFFGFVALAVAIPLLVWLTWAQPKLLKLKQKNGPRMTEISMGLSKPKNMKQDKEAWYRPYDVILILPRRYAQLFAKENREQLKSTTELDADWL